MRNFLLAAVATAAIASPAVARDNSGYVGVEGGAMLVEKQNVHGAVDFTSNTDVVDIVDAHIGSLRYKTGFDVDAIAGYDFGMFRVEGELGYKRASTKSFRLDDPGFFQTLNAAAGTTIGVDDFALHGHTSVLSGMINGLLDFTPGDSVGGYVGGGFGRARVKELGDSDSAWAWQLIAGLAFPVSPNIDVGLKYRYFHTGKLNFNDDFDFTPAGTTCGTITCTGGTVFVDTRSKFKSHSLLLSLVYNFAAPVPPPPPPAPPPPPPPPAPATQTCPDGSVILATDACPAPPPPPPPPPPAPERGL